MELQSANRLPHPSLPEVLFYMLNNPKETPPHCLTEAARRGWKKAHRTGRTHKFSFTGFVTTLCNAAPAKTRKRAGHQPPLRTENRPHYLQDLRISLMYTYNAIAQPLGEITSRHRDTTQKCTAKSKTIKLFY